MAFQNFFATKLFTDIGAADTTITLETVPLATSGRLVLEARNPTQREVIKYTGISGNQITGVTRGQGGTAAKQHLKNSLVEMNATAEDLQDLYDAFNSFSASNNDWRAAATAVSSVVYNGQGSYTMNVASNLTNVISPGMRLRTTRTVAAPTQSALLNGTNQYFVKTAPGGMTFTDDFVVSAWVKLSSYASAGIISRFNGTSGWILQVNAEGRVFLRGFNAGVANVRDISSYQSLPLNRWVHIAAQLDMSAHTANTTTSYVMLDGVNVPCSVSQAGTNPSALVQAGNLEIGSQNGGTSPFPGKIAQVAIFSAKVTQATMRNYISQGLTGSEPSLISAYSLSNSLNDVKGVNNLTAMNSATTTNADSPFGGQADGSISSTLDYGIVQAITPTTITVQTPEGGTIPVVGGVSALHYSGVRAPFGFPANTERWDIMTLIRFDLVSGNLPSWVNLSVQLEVPVGKFNISNKGTVSANRAASGSLGVMSGLSTNTAGFSESTSPYFIYNATAIDFYQGVYGIYAVNNFDASTTLYWLLKAENSGVYASVGIRGNRGDAIIRAENAYL